WSLAELAEKGIEVDEAFVYEALRGLWALQASDRTLYHKSYVGINGLAVSNYIDMRYGVLQGWAGHFLTTKNVLSSEMLMPVGGRRLELEYSLYDLAGRAIADYEANFLSDARTVVIVAKSLELFFPEDKDGIHVYMLGSGDIVKAAVRMLVAIVPDRIGKLTICSPHNAQRAVDELVGVVNNAFELEAEYNQESLFSADMVVAATSNRENMPPAIPTMQVMKPNVVLVTLATNEAPEDFVEHLLAGNGLALCDNTHCVSDRDHQTLALYFSRRGTTLSDKADDYNVRQFCDAVMGNVIRQEGQPVGVFASGMASADALLAAAIFTAHAKEKKLI
ncbi:unnamed protein product, partial [Ectocarpus sp. 12 AP-2014]